MTLFKRKLSYTNVLSKLLQILVHTKCGSFQGYTQKIIVLLLVIITCAKCRHSYPKDIEFILRGTENSLELEKVVHHYDNLRDSQKLKAAYFLIRNMSAQFHYEGYSLKKYDTVLNYVVSLVSTNLVSPRQAWDSIPPTLKASINLGDTIKVRDIDVVTADFLIENIDLAFEAWKFPWARHLTFEQFSRYILPYKVKNEPLRIWRKEFMVRYKWVIDSLKGNSDFRRAATLINSDLKKWFYINAKFDCPWDLTASDLLKIKVGTCFEACQITAYAMRAMGIPVTFDFTPFWANKAGSHSWNCLLNGATSIIFMGTESNPGYEKIEYSGYNYKGVAGMKRKRAKIYRYSFLDEPSNRLVDFPERFFFSNLEDVTSQFVPTSNVKIEKRECYDLNDSIAYLCVFNNKKWRAISKSKTADNALYFSYMGRDIVYLPACHTENDYKAIADAFILTKEGRIKVLNPDTKNLKTCIFYRKYPEDETNVITPNNKYELLYWNKEWISLGTQKASKNYLLYNNVPDNALLWIVNLDKGFQERIFTMDNSQQVWW